MGINWIVNALGLLVGFPLPTNMNHLQNVWIIAVLKTTVQYYWRRCLQFQGFWNKTCPWTAFLKALFYFCRNSQSLLITHTQARTHAHAHTHTHTSKKSCAETLRKAEQSIEPPIPLVFRPPKIHHFNHLLFFWLKNVSLTLSFPQNRPAHTHPHTHTHTHAQTHFLILKYSRIPHISVIWARLIHILVDLTVK